MKTLPQEAVDKLREVLQAADAARAELLQAQEALEATPEYERVAAAIEALDRAEKRMVATRILLDADHDVRENAVVDLDTCEVCGPREEPTLEEKSMEALRTLTKRHARAAAVRNIVAEQQKNQVK